MHQKKIFSFVTVLTVMACINLAAQPVYERHTHEVYNYLSRMAQKGVLVFDDNIRPLSKTYILSCLDSVALHVATLTAVERKELDFYRKEFNEGERKRILAIRGDDFTLWADPIVTASYMGGSGRDIKGTSSGINFWGRIGKRLGYQFSFHDANESGKGLDTSGKTLFSGSTTGRVRQNAYMVNRQNYTELRASIRYEFNRGAVSVGQDYLTWGYGENGKLVLSDKAPVYPYIRFDYKPVSWLSFNYTHAWLRSNVIDSSASYPIPGGGPYGTTRPVEVSKYMASHSIDVRLMKGLNFSVGESIIYNDQLSMGYLIPIMFFKAYDNAIANDAITKGSNGHFFFQLSSRDQLRNTHLYGTLFVDEIKLGSIFDSKKQRNQLGYTVGGSVTDLGIPYLTLGAEYTRIRPFVYRNFLPAQNYTHQNYLLGDWLGNNGDRVIVFGRYTPLPRLKLYARYSHLRKGGAGTLDQQYDVTVPQPPFLFDFLQASDEMFFSADYEWLYRLRLNASYRRFDQVSLFGIGMTYGL
jgi:hypothetical protein